MATPVLNDVYELTAEQRYKGQRVYNVYFYEIGANFVTTTPTVAEVLVTNWIAQILPLLKECQSSDIVYTSIRARNLFNDADGFDAAVTLSGNAAAADDLPTFNAMSFTLNTDTTAVRAGKKRLAGVTEAYQTEGILDTAAALAALAISAEQMEKPVTVGTVIQDPVFFPCLVKRIREGSSGAYTYRLPAAREESITSRVLSALFDVMVTSQISRKMGVGI